jgi:hypothetical protein
VDPAFLAALPLIKLPAVIPQPLSGRATPPSRFKRVVGWMLVVAFLAAVVATIIGMGPLAFLLALGSMFVFRVFQAVVEALFRSVSHHKRAGPEAVRPAEKRVIGRPRLTTRAPPSGLGNSRWSAALGLGRWLATRLRPKLHEDRL